MRPIASCASSTAEIFFAASADDNSTAVLKLHCDFAKAYSPVSFYVFRDKSRRAYQNADAEHDDPAEHDLEHRLHERRIHIARANISDGPQFKEDHDTRNRGRDPESVGPTVRHQIRHGVAKAAECRHQSASQPAKPG